MKRKCKNCEGTGFVPSPTHIKKNPDLDYKSKCDYCNGKGYRTRYYGKDD